MWEKRWEGIEMGVDGKVCFGDLTGHALFLPEVDLLGHTVPKETRGDEVTVVTDAKMTKGVMVVKICLWEETGMRATM
jgi:hypothetical protein